MLRCFLRDKNGNMAAVIVCRWDYYLYGMLMPDRHGNSSDYRYGYQGSESDDEVKGEKNSYTTHFRQLDVRIGRWLSLDPVVQPWQSPYCSMDNSPVLYNDILGDDVIKGKGEGVTNKQFREYKRSIRQLRRNSETFNAMYKDFKNDKNKTYVFEATNSNNGGETREENGEVIMRYGINTPPIEESEYVNMITTIAHEAGHAWRDNLNNLDIEFPTQPNAEYRENSFKYSDSYILAYNQWVRETAKVHESTEREASHIENIVISELMNTEKKKFKSLTLRTGYYPSYHAVLYIDDDKKIRYKLEIRFSEHYNLLNTPRDSEYYLKNKHNIHEENNVKPIEK